MSNSKKSPVVAPVKTVAPVAPVNNPAVVAKPAPVVAKAVPAAPAPVVAPKVEATKPVVTAKLEPAKMDAPKPVAPAAMKPVTAKPVAPVAKPAETPKPAVAAKVAAVKAPVVAPKVVETAPKAAPKAAAKAANGSPVATMMKPVAALQENVRANTEKALTEFRGRYAEVKGIAESATTRLEVSMKAAQTGSREIGVALFDIVKAQTHANLDHAKQLAAAKSLPELMTAQQAFMLSQFQSAQARAKDVATLAGKIASDVTTPLRASFELMLRR
jgi:hypothetical protein